MNQQRSIRFFLSNRYPFLCQLGNRRGQDLLGLVLQPCIDLRLEPAAGAADIVGYGVVEFPSTHTAALVMLDSRQDFLDVAFLFEQGLRQQSEGLPLDTIGNTNAHNTGQFVIVRDDILDDLIDQTLRGIPVLDHHVAFRSYTGQIRCRICCDVPS